MRQIKSIISSALAVVALVSCNVYQEPEYRVPNYDPAGKTIVSIEDLKSNHTLGGAPKCIDTLKINGENVAGPFLLHGIVVGDDESGNIYKSIYLQDETGGINISIDQVNLYNYMPVGQELYIEIDSMFIGDYNKSFQLGDTVTDKRYGLEMARYDWSKELRRKRFYPHGTPDEDACKKFIREIHSANEISDFMYNTLVVLKGVTMKDAEKLTPWAVKEQTVNRTAVFSDGTEIVVRTSGYCNFYADYMPAGRGNLTGILSVFGTTKQFYIRSRADIKGFVEE